MNGKPVVAIGKIIYNCDSKYIVESKSLKLYLNSFNNHKFESTEIVVNTMKKDLSKILHTDVIVEISPLDIIYNIVQPQGICIDSLNL